MDHHLTHSLASVLTTSSCESQLLLTVENFVKTIDYRDAAMVDCATAFDKVSQHHITANYGIRVYFLQINYWLTKHIHHVVECNSRLCAGTNSFFYTKEITSRGRYALLLMIARIVHHRTMTFQSGGKRLANGHPNITSLKSTTLYVINGTTLKMVSQFEYNARPQILTSKLYVRHKARLVFLT